MKDLNVFFTNPGPHGFHRTLDFSAQPSATLPPSKQPTKFPGDSIDRVDWIRDSIGLELQINFTFKQTYPDTMAVPWIIVPGICNLD